MQVMSYFIDRAVFRLKEVAGGGVESVLFEEEADFVAGGEEVVVADVGIIVGGEFGHGMVGDGEGGEHLLGFVEEGGGCCGGEGGRDDEVAIFIVGLELFFCETTLRVASGGFRCWRCCR